jgi:hypothetical protein
MAARTTRTKHNDKTREKIKVTQIVNRLQDFVLGESTVGHPKIELSAAQVKAAQILLAKKLPDLTASDITTHEAETPMAEKFQLLVNQIGEQQARIIYPDLADKYLGPTVTKAPTSESPSLIQ